MILVSNLVTRSACVLRPARVLAALSFLVLSVPATAAEADAVAAVDSLARFVPPESNLCIEVRGLRGLMELRQFAALERLLQSPGSTAGAEVQFAPWLGRIKAIAEIDRDTLLQSFFGEQVAVAAPNWERLAEGVVLARVREPGVIERLFAKARSPVLTLEGGRRVCALDRKDGLWLAARGDIIVLGPSRGPGSYFLRVADLLTGGDGRPTLLSDAQFAEARRGLPRDPRGWLFLRREEDSSEASAGAAVQHGRISRLVDDLFLRATYVAAAIEVRPGEFRITAVGHTSRPPSFLTRGSKLDGHEPPVPDDTLITWRFGYDYGSAYQSLLASGGGMARFLLALAASATPSVDLARDVVAKLGPESVLMVGAADGSSVGTPFDLPLVSFAVRYTGPKETVEQTAEAVADRLATICNFQTLRAGREDLLRVTEHTHAGVPYRTLPIGRFLATQSECEFFAHIELAWCAHEGWLIVSSHPIHLRQILDSRAFDNTAAQPGLPEPVAVPASVPGQVVVMRPRAVARVIDGWVDYLQKAHPHMLADGWWELARQRRTGARVQLGLGLKADPAQPGKVLVALTLEGWPADNLIAKGDYILGVDGQLLSTENALADFKRLVRHRKYIDRVVLRVEHEGKARDVQVNIPAAPGAEPVAKNPVRLLAPLARLCEDFTLATYRISFDQPDQFLAELVLRFNTRTDGGDMSTAARAAPAR